MLIGAQASFPREISVIIAPQPSGGRGAVSPGRGIGFHHDRAERYFQGIDDRLGRWRATDAMGGYLGDEF